MDSQSVEELRKWINEDLSGLDVIKNEDDDPDDEILFEESEKGQLFFMPVIKTKEGKYQVRLYMDEDHHNYSQTSVENMPKLEYLINLNKKEYIESEIFDDIDQANEYAQKRSNDLKKNIKNESRVVRERIMPTECARDPDTHLKKGDHIRRALFNKPIVKDLMHHDAIYVGKIDGIPRVIHIMNDETEPSHNAKNNSCARLGKFHENFCLAGPDDKKLDDVTIKVLVYPKRFRRREEIVCHAILLAAAKYRENEYHFLFKNCQHFATACSCGKDTMPDKAPILSSLRFIDNMSAMVRQVLGPTLLDSCITCLKDIINDLFGTRPGQDSDQLQQATWEKIERMLEILGGSEENKQERILEILDTN